MSSVRSRILEALAELERLHPAPLLLAEAVRLLQDADAHPEDLAELIGTDAALTTDVIRLCNSACYSNPQPISSLVEALQFLGYNEIFRVVALNISRATLVSDLTGYGIDRNACWEESVMGGLFVAGLAPGLRLSPPLAFTTGLLLPIGRLAINQALVIAGVKLSPAPGEVWESQELAHVGISHPEAGALLLERWRFSRQLQDAVRAQCLEPQPEDPPLVAAAQTARRVLDAKVPVADLLPPCLSLRLAQANLDSARLAEIRDRAEERLGALRASLRI